MAELEEIHVGLSFVHALKMGPLGIEMNFIDIFNHLKNLLFFIAGHC